MPFERGTHAENKQRGEAFPACDIAGIDEKADRVGFEDRVARERRRELWTRRGRDIVE